MKTTPLHPTSYDRFAIADTLAEIQTVDPYLTSSETPAFYGSQQDEEQLFNTIRTAPETSAEIFKDIGSDPDLTPNEATFLRHTVRPSHEGPVAAIPQVQAWYPNASLGTDPEERRQRDLRAMRESYATMDELMAVQFDGRQPARPEPVAQTTVRRIDPATGRVISTTTTINPWQPLLDAPSKIATVPAPQLQTITSRVAPPNTTPNRPIIQSSLAPVPNLPDPAAPATPAHPIPASPSSAALSQPQTSSTQPTSTLPRRWWIYALLIGVGLYLLTSKSSKST